MLRCGIGMRAQSGSRFIDLGDDGAVQQAAGTPVLGCVAGRGVAGTPRHVSKRRLDVGITAQRSLRALRGSRWQVGEASVQRRAGLY
jgi:hypothetical protein